MLMTRCKLVHKCLRVWKYSKVIKTRIWHKATNIANRRSHRTSDQMKTAWTEESRRHVSSLNRMIPGSTLICTPWRLRSGRRHTIRRHRMGHRMFTRKAFLVRDWARRVRQDKYTMLITRALRVWIASLQIESLTSAANHKVTWYSNSMSWTYTLLCKTRGIWPMVVSSCPSTIATEDKTAATMDNSATKDSTAMDREVSYLGLWTQEYKQMQHSMEVSWSKIKTNKDKFQQIRCRRQGLASAIKEQHIQNSEVQMDQLVQTKQVVKRTWLNKDTEDNILRTSVNKPSAHSNRTKTSWEIRNRWCTSRSSKWWVCMRNVAEILKDPLCSMEWVDKEDLKTLVFLCQTTSTCTNVIRHRLLKLIIKKTFSELA